MLWLGAALAVCALCVAASIARLQLVLSVVHLDRAPPRARDALDPAAPLGSLEWQLRDALDGADSWQALGELERDQRLALAQDELEFALQRGRRWPTVAARVCSSLGFLLAALQLRAALLTPELSWQQSAPQLLYAVQIVASAFCASLLCAALGREANRLQKLESTKVFAWLEALAQGA